jgi:hypothetical protein
MSALALETVSQLVAIAVARQPPPMVIRDL